MDRAFKNVLRVEPHRVRKHPRNRYDVHYLDERLYRLVTRLAPAPPERRPCGIEDYGSFLTFPVRDTRQLLVLPDETELRRADLVKMEIYMPVLAAMAGEGLLEKRLGVSADDLIVVVLNPCSVSFLDEQWKAVLEGAAKGPLAELEAEVEESIRKRHEQLGEQVDEADLAARISSLHDEAAAFRKMLGRAALGIELVGWDLLEYKYGAACGGCDEKKALEHQRRILKEAAARVRDAVRSRLEAGTVPGAAEAARVFLSHMLSDEEIDSIPEPFVF